jgi:hypothetical protein
VNKTLKSITGLVLAGALVFAPLAVGAASADEVVAPPVETTEVVAEPTPEPAPVEAPAPEPEAPIAPVEEVAVETPAVEAPAEAEEVEATVAVEPAAPAPVEAKVEAPAPVVAPQTKPTEPNEGVCSGTHLVADDGANDEGTETYTAPEGFLISAYCVKAGSIKQGDGPEYITLDQPVASITITHSSGKDISHFSVTLVEIPDEEPGLATGSLTVNPPTCEDRNGDATLTATNAVVTSVTRDGVPDAVVTPGTFEDVAPATYVVVLTANEGFEFAGGESTLSLEVTVPEPLTDEDCVVITEPTITVAINCSAENEVTFTVVNPNLTSVPVTAAFDFNGDGAADASEVLTVVPGTTVLPYNFAEDTSVGVVVLFGETVIFDETITVDCEPDVVPVPALFAAEPTPPTCETAGSFDFEGTFPNVTVTVTPAYDGPGEYLLTVTANPGYAFPDGDTEKTRVIVVEGALGFQSEDPEAPCFLATPVFVTPEAPEFVDECGTDEDGYFLPEDTDEYFYVVSEDGDTVTIEVIIDAEGVEFAEGAVTEWEFTFTDEACPVTPPVVNPPAPGPAVVVVPAKPVTSTQALAVTGGPDMTLWAAGSVLALIAGLGLTVLRRVRQGA